MKKILTILIFSPVFLSAQIVQTFGSIETGMIGKSTSVKNDDIVAVARHNALMYGDVSFTLNRGKFYLKQSALTTFKYRQGKTSFTPVDITWNTELYVNFCWGKIGFDHMCLHPVENNMSEPEADRMRSSYDRIYVKFKIGEHPND